MLMSSIKESKEVSLSQNTIALKGFVLSLQLVMIEVVPALTEFVQDGNSSGSECEIGEEDENFDDDKGEKKSISPGHTRETDAEGKAIVHSIIVDGDKETDTNEELDWSDEEEDCNVDNLLKLIREGYQFSQSSFSGGVSKLEVMKMWEEAKAELLNRTNTKTKQSIPTELPNVIDVAVLAALVKENLKEDFTRLESEIQTLKESTINFQKHVLANLTENFGKLESYMEILATHKRGQANAVNAGGEGSHQRDNPTGSPIKVGNQTNLDIPDVIGDAVRFVDQLTGAGREGSTREAVSEGVCEEGGAEAAPPTRKTAANVSENVCLTAATRSNSGLILEPDYYFLIQVSLSA